MSIQKSGWYEVFEICSSGLEEIESIVEEGTYLVTGASGNIAKYIVAFLLKKSNVKVIAVCHDEIRGKDVFSEFVNSPNLRIMEQDITVKWTLEEKVDFIIHAAGICSNYICRMRPIEVLNTNIVGTNNVLELGMRLKVKKFLFISSASVYGRLGETIGGFAENYRGCLDFTNIANVYAVSKRAGEALCIACKQQMPVIIVRPFHIIEPMMMLEKSNVLGGFYSSLLANYKILLNTDGKQERNFIWIMDLVKIIFIILNKFEDGEYNIGNPYGTLSMFEMASLMKEKMTEIFPDMKNAEVAVCSKFLAKESNMIDLVPDLSKMLEICKSYNIDFLDPEQAMLLCIKQISKLENI